MSTSSIECTHSYSAGAPAVDAEEEMQCRSATRVPRGEHAYHVRLTYLAETLRNCLAGCASGAGPEFVAFCLGPPARLASPTHLCTKQRVRTLSGSYFACIGSDSSFCGPSMLPPLSQTSGPGKGRVNVCTGTRKISAATLTWPGIPLRAALYAVQPAGKVSRLSIPLSNRAHIGEGGFLGATPSFPNTFKRVPS
jgi:hypothetical protein